MEKIIVVSKGNWGLPNPGLKKMLEPVKLDACVWFGEVYWGLVEGQEYEFSGDPELLKNPKGLGKLFDVKGKAKAPPKLKDDK